MDLTAYQERITYLGEINCHHNLKPLTEQEVNNCLHNTFWPDGSKKTVFDLVKPGKKTCIVVSDHTRKTATDIILQPVISGLTAKGCRTADISILIASGIHRHPTMAEMDRILGKKMFDLFKGRIFCHNPDDPAGLFEAGTTKRGHRVRLNKRLKESDHVILTGAVLYHYHAGFGGGRKSIVPGLASRETIAYNHSLTLDPSQDCVHPDVQIGRLDGNPVAEEMMEDAMFCQPDIIINTVLSTSGELVGVFSGDMVLAHREACRMAEKTCRADLKEKADLVIASAIPATNWIQSHKSLFNSSRAINDTGIIVLEAPCPEGIGDERFKHWVSIKDIPTLYRELRKTPEILGQTALSTRLRGQQTLLVTSMTQADRDILGIETAPDINCAIDTAISRLTVRLGRKPTCYTMKKAAYIVPF
jgi:lactate racemase